MRRKFHFEITCKRKDNRESHQLPIAIDFWNCEMIPAKIRINRHPPQQTWVILWVSWCSWSDYSLDIWLAFRNRRSFKRLWWILSYHSHVLLLLLMLSSTSNSQPLNSLWQAHKLPENSWRGRGVSGDKNCRTEDSVLTHFSTIFLSFPSSLPHFLPSNNKKKEMKEGWWINDSQLNLYVDALGVLLLLHPPAPFIPVNH